MKAHGEVMLIKRRSIPKGAKRKPVSGEYVIIADSETTGNHHVVDLVEGMEVYEKDGSMWLDVPAETTVRCLIKERHDEITVEPGIHEIVPQKEFDYLTGEKRAVRD